MRILRELSNQDGTNKSFLTLICTIIQCWSKTWHRICFVQVQLYFYLLTILINSYLYLQNYIPLQFLFHYFFLLDCSLNQHSKITLQVSVGQCPIKLICIYVIFPEFSSFRHKMEGSTSHQQPPTPRRHSIAIAMQNLRLTPGRPRSGSSRRSSITRSISAGLSLVQRRASRSSSLDFGDCDLQMDKSLVEGALARHFDDKSIKVINGEILGLMANLYLYTGVKYENKKIF